MQKWQQKISTLSLFFDATHCTASKAAAGCKLSTLLLCPFRCLAEIGSYTHIHKFLQTLVSKSAGLLSPALLCIYWVHSRIGLLGEGQKELVCTDKTQFNYGTNRTLQSCSRIRMNANNNLHHLGQSSLFLTILIIAISASLRRPLEGQKSHGLLKRTFDRVFVQVVCNDDDQVV